MSEELKPIDAFDMIVREYLEGADHEDELCPEDDTCDCENIAHLNKCCALVDRTLRDSAAELANLRARVAELESWKSVLMSEYTTRDLQYAAVCEDMHKSSARVAELEREVEAWRHAANEWADAATNGPCWIKNARDGVSTVDEALAAMAIDFEECRASQPHSALAPRAEVKP